MGIFWKLAEAVVYIAVSILTAATGRLVKSESGNSSGNNSPGVHPEKAAWENQKVLFSSDFLRIRSRAGE
ncbi:MAG: hypothetical protein AMXMBFR48_14570 [Ignavibacteriales bacterium]